MLKSNQVRIIDWFLWTINSTSDISYPRDWLGLVPATALCYWVLFWGESSWLFYELPPLYQVLWEATIVHNFTVQERENLANAIIWSSGIIRRLNKPCFSQGGVFKKYQDIIYHPCSFLWLLSALAGMKSWDQAADSTTPGLQLS